MARAPSLASPTLSPFGGGGGGFGAFSIIDPGREAYITFLKVENAWQNGQATDPDYLAAMRTYANALPEGSSNRLNTEQRIVETTYRVERNVLVSKIDAGTKELSDLLTFDQAHLQGLEPDSETYRDRLDLVHQTQKQIFSEAEDEIAQHYQDGTLTTTQLQAWYRSQQSIYTDNPDLSDALDKRVHDLDQRVLDERDSRTITDYNAGKLTDDEFLVYARAARARYSTGTSQAQDWDKRIETAGIARTENTLLYRYGLSQKYAELQQFIKSNGPGSGRTSTSTSTRIVLGADGQWHSVTSTSTKAVKPSAAEINAHKKLQVELADAKRQMAEIQHQLGAAPGGGSWVSTNRMITYYEGRLSGLAKGSADWYAMQEKIDSLQERQHAETVLSKQGIKITYPGGGGGTSTTHAAGGGGGGLASKASPASARTNLTIDQFMSSLARVESGGRYDARNKASGAFGKYQIMPANWPAWAARYLGDANAEQTPKNQEAVAKGRIAEMYKHMGSWDAVAYKWLTGASGDVAKNPAVWSAAGRRYVTNVMGSLGLSPQRPAAGATTTPRAATTAAAQGKTPAATAPADNRGKTGGLSEIVSVTTSRRSGTGQISTRATSFPTNLDGRAFENFYANYERAFKSGAEGFVDSSSGKPIAYFIGSNPLDRIERMRDLDDLRIEYYTTRAKAYAGTATEITAHNQINSAIKDLAAHEYQILDTANSGRGGADNRSVNPIAGGVRLLDKTNAAIAGEIAAANAAYGRGDFQSAYAHMLLAGHYLDASTMTSGPEAGKRVDTVARLAGYEASSEQLLARIQAKYGGITADEALGTEGGGGSLNKDLERLRSAQAELATSLSKGDDLMNTIKSQVKVDAKGNVVLDSRGQAQLDDGWARFISPSGTVDIKRVPPTGVDPQTGQTQRAPEGKYVKVVTKVGATVEDAYAAWTIGNVGWIRGADGVNRAMQGKVVTVVVDGHEQTLFEDPLNPGHWNSKAIVFNPPAGFKAIGDGKGNTIYQFAGSKENAGTTFSLQFDPKTGTYLVIGNRPASFQHPAPIDNQPVGGAGDANVLALLTEAGLTRDSSSSSSEDFTDSTAPVFGMSPKDYASFLHGPVAPALRPGAPDERGIRGGGGIPTPSLNSSGSPDDRDVHPVDERGMRGSIAPPAAVALNSSGSPDERDERNNAARTPASKTALPPIRLPTLNSMDTPNELMAEKRQVVAAKRLAVTQPSTGARAGARVVSHSPRRPLPQRKVPPPPAKRPTVKPTPLPALKTPYSAQKLAILEKI